MLTSRSGNQGNASAVPPSIDVLRRRARHRLIGAAVLVLLGVVGFSLLLDAPPRPLPVDIPIVIPAKNSPPAREPAKTSDAVPKKASETVATGDSLGAREEVVPAKPASVEPATTERKPEPAELAKPAVSAKVAVNTEPAKPETTKTETPKAEPAKTAQSDAARARALLEGKTTEKAADKSASGKDERVVVQVGAFADAARAREVRLKLERAGLKTYTHVADTSEGRRIRVRVGPFSSKAEADKAAARVKALGLPAAVLTL